MELDSNLDPVPHCTVPMWIRSIVFVSLAPALIVQNKKFVAKVSICQKSKLVKIELQYVPVNMLPTSYLNFLLFARKMLDKNGL